MADTDAAESGTDRRTFLHCAQKAPRKHRPNPLPKPASIPENLSKYRKDSYKIIVMIMKTRLLFAAAFAAAFAACAKEKVVERPAFSSGNLSFCPKTLILGEASTTIGFKLQGYSWSLDSLSHLAAGEKTYRMTGAKVFRRSEDGTVKSEELLLNGGYFPNENGIPDSVSIDFEPVDPEVKAVDFIEFEGSNFNSFGIRLDGKCYPFALEKAGKFPYAADEPLPAIEPRFGEARLTGSIFRGDGTQTYAKVLGIDNRLSDDRCLHLNENSYRLASGSSHLAYVTISNYEKRFRVMMIPGYDNRFSVDEPAYWASVTGASRKPIPTDRIIQFEGAFADLQQVLYDEQDFENSMWDVAPEMLWDAVQKELHKIENNRKYSRRQKEFGRLKIEYDYLKQYTNFAKKDKATLKDTHAKELEILKDGRSFYLIGNADFLQYAHANHIDGVVTDWMEGFEKAENMAKRIRSLEVMPETAFDSIPEMFHHEVKELNDSTRAMVEKYRASANEVRLMNVPDCAGSEFFDKVVSENPDVVLVFDLWATWCGPCMQGIKAMKPLKEEWAGRPIRFVYVTEEDSPAKDWTREIASMPGLHYRLPGDMWNELLGESRGIPQYFVYDRHGNRSGSQLGWGDVDSIKHMVKEALEK